MEVVATDDLSGGFRENVPDGAEFVLGDLRDGDFVRSLWDGGPLRLRLPPRRLRGRGALALHPRLQLPHQPRGQRPPDQPGDPERRRALRVHLLDRRLRRRPGADDGGPDAAAGGPVRDLEVRGGARPGGRSRDVRARLHSVPPAQRLRRAPEHRRPLPQRHRHLHERRAAGEADAGVRRRPPDPRLLPHRGRGAHHQPLAAASRPPATRSTTSAPTGPTRSSSWPTRSREPSASSRSSSTWRRATRWCTRSPTTAR